MRIQLVTRRTDHKITNPRITVVRPEEYNIYTHLLTKTTNGTCSEEVGQTDWFTLGHDIETKFEKPEVSVDGLLLSSFHNYGDDVLVIDNTSVHNNEIFTTAILKRCLFIAHNADFEARWGVVTGFLPMRYACTMVNGKRLLSGQKGFKHDLISNITRWLGPDEVPIEMEKDIRNDFASITIFEDQHILYNAADSIRLKRLYFAQLEEAKQLNQLFLHNTINSRIIIPIAKAEVTGIRHDSERWKQITEERITKAANICVELDSLVIGYGLDPGLINPEARKKREQLERRTIRNQERLLKLQAQLKRLEELNKTHLKSYRVTQEQIEKLGKLEEISSLEQEVTSINWASSKQVLKVFESVGCPVPQAKDNRTHSLKNSVGKEARANWFVNNPVSPFLEFMKLFDSFKKVEHNIKSFGFKWIDQYVRNGRAYTLLDQAGADTGRFTSGDKKPPGIPKEYAQMQQIPGRGEDKVYRTCFLADEGRALIIADYKNCEGVLMISQSKDLAMKRITEMEDQHSYLGTVAWRAAYAERYKRTNDPKDLALSLEYEMNQSTPEKTEERTRFKNSAGLFPVVYGVTANKVAATAQVTEAEGQAMIDAIKREVPNVILTLDAKSKEASTYGYVTHNERTGSRRWFTPILDHLHYGFPLTRKEIVEAEMAARNSPIQGSNSDIMKEAIAAVELWTNLFKQDLRFLLTVHDEGVWDCPEELADFFVGKIRSIMQRVAQNYLIPEIKMEADVKAANYWKK